MKKTLLMTLAAATLSLTACSEKEVSNPFFSEWTTPFQVPPFDEIKYEHFIPAFEEGMQLEVAEIEAIVSNTDAPTFENTIVPYTTSGEFLGRVRTVFSALCGTEMCDELEAIQTATNSKLTAHNSDISLNETLFQRIKAVYEGREAAGYDAVQMRLVEKVYKGFERNGANLGAEQKEALRAIDKQLSELSIKFGKNLREDNSSFALIIDSEADLAGVPEANIAAAAAEAEARGQAGKWAFTLDKPSMLPFLQYAENRDLRKTLYTGYLERANNDNETDNKKVISEIANLRLERAKLMGYTSHADFIVSQNMSKTPEAVNSLLAELWTPAVARAKEELKEMKAIKGDNDFESWDWWYYSEKLREKKYNLNEDEIRPYFVLDNVLQGCFDLTTKLYGLSYKEITESMPLYNKENRVFEVSDKDGSHLGVVYFDFHPRSSKRVGAWCGSFRGQKYDADGNFVTPVATIVCNFTKPVGDDPALISLDEVETLFHEYGHGLHGLFRDVKYSALSSVERDFVELPSQIMENWALEPEVLATYAKHYKTGETIPAELVEKIQNSSLFNQGFATVEYLAASILDMEYHTITEAGDIDVAKFEEAVLAKYGAMDEIAPRYCSTYFQHIFSSGYSAGYYSYIWAEVLDADAYEAFVESGDLYNQEIAAKFRKEVLSQGGQADGGVLYRNFRGKDASREPLMKNRGLI
ncbi:MAG: M3 family metallopeptidase [Rikenellaceae bacterium]